MREIGYVVRERGLRRGEWEEEEETDLLIPSFVLFSFPSFFVCCCG